MLMLPVITELGEDDIQKRRTTKATDKRGQSFNVAKSTDLMIRKEFCITPKKCFTLLQDNKAIDSLNRVI
jgi:hypothetical protein